MAFTGPGDDRSAIRELYGTFADGASRCDRATWLGCWTDDSCWWTHYFERSGRESIGEQYDPLMADVATVTFFTQIGAIEVEGERARARACCSERLVLEDGGSYRLTGRYEDELRRERGKWLFARRICNVMTEEKSER